jgi:hypothetical protein
MVSDPRRAKNNGVTFAPDAGKTAETGQRDTLFDRDWDELVIKFDPSRDRFEVKTACGNESASMKMNLGQILAPEGKK